MVTQPLIKHRPAPAESAEPARRPIRVLVVDDHPAVRAGVARLIEDHPGMLVVGEARRAEEALGRLDSLPDVLVVDYHLGGQRSGLWLTHQLSGLEEPPSVLIYSAFADEALALAAIVAGADGLLDKRSLGEELYHAIRRLASGHRVLPAISRPLALAIGARLRPREQAILGMLLHGVDPGEIARRLSMSGNELAATRSGMLLTLAPKLGQAAPPAKSPLDYEPSRAHLATRA